ncbi:MAG: hypothetical protein RH917_00695 [Lacipirellulaceae bacterium]
MSSSRFSFGRRIVQFGLAVLCIFLVSFIVIYVRFTWETLTFSQLQERQLHVLESIFENSQTSYLQEHWQDDLAIRNVWGNVTYFHTKTSNDEMRVLLAELESRLESNKVMSDSQRINDIYDLMLTTNSTPEFINKYRKADLERFLHFTQIDKNDLDAE